MSYGRESREKVEKKNECARAGIQGGRGTSSEGLKDGSTFYVDYVIDYLSCWDEASLARINTIHQIRFDRVVDRA